MGIKYPKAEEITDKHQALVVSLGGAAAISDPTGDPICMLATNICNGWNAANPKKLGIEVVGGTSPFYSSRRITEEMMQRLEWIAQKSHITPKLVLIGKSMGGCKLHKVTDRLEEEGVNVDLFIGVDISCHIARHYDYYDRMGNDNKVFPNCVKSLVNFYQIRAGESQCGHIAIWNAPEACEHKGPRAMCRDFNIDVNHDYIQVDDQGRITFGGKLRAMFSRTWVLASVIPDQNVRTVSRRMPNMGRATLSALVSKDHRSQGRRDC